MGTKAQATLGDLMTTLYDEYLAVYGDEDMASVAAAATINDFLGQRAIAASALPQQPHPTFGNPEPAAA